VSGSSLTSSITRRDFLRTSAAAAAVALPAGPFAMLRTGDGYDLVIRRGTVFDGTGAPGRDVDVAITGGRIVQVARRISGPARVEIDAQGRAVAPGFIDIHSHADGTLFEDGRLESVIRQGVTTVVVGQDGSSHAPMRANQPRGHPFARLADFFTAVERSGSSANVASMVGLGTIRGVVIGDDNRPATPAEVEAMRAHVEAALDDGACGASTGLEYTPGAFASREELIAMCTPLAKRDLPYATHMRNEDDRVLESVDEAIAIATGAHCPLEISHLKTEGPRNWGKLDGVFERIDRARKSGVDAGYDCYPYIAYQTGLDNLFPASDRDAGTDAFLARLTAPATKDALRTAALAKVALIGGWDHLLISSVTSDSDRSLEGRRIGEIATAAGKDPYDVTVGLLTQNHGSVTIVGFAMSEDNVTRTLANPLAKVCSDGGAGAIDGPAHAGHPHPRAFGTFPRVLGHYVRDAKALTLQSAIHKMTAASAARLRLKDRGHLAPGFAADVVVFDPATVADLATFSDPFQYPVGISLVVVNGSVVLRDGDRTPDRPGRSLRPTTA
jgi:N-acyl-D-amino-acid deacylase